MFLKEEIFFLNIGNIPATLLRLYILKISRECTFTYQHNTLKKINNTWSIWSVSIKPWYIFFHETLMTVNWLSLFCNDLLPLLICLCLHFTFSKLQQCINQVVFVLKAYIMRIFNKHIHHIMYNIWKVNEIYLKMLQKGARYLLKIRKICFRIDFHLKILYTLYFNTLQCIYFIWWTVYFP